MERKDGRQANQIRTVTLTPDYVTYPEGSVLIAMGETRVLCNVTIELGVPRWMQAQDKVGGWITAEYALLPRSTHTRTTRETRGLGGRTQEIRRLIGRSLRAGFNLAALGERTCIVDCDVIQADGGTRTAAITGGYTALVVAFKRLVAAGEIDSAIFRAPVAAISCGKVSGEYWLDLCYEEDARAEVDCNLVMNASGEFIEVQGSAEGGTFDRQGLNTMLDLAWHGLQPLFEAQRALLDTF